ncbi:MAG TPA: MFS transporter [Ensifer sp.]|nr:MFS transporter [Ensifer sp.]
MSNVEVQSASAATAAPGFNKVVTSAAIGQFVEWYDFVIYAYSATTIAKLFFPSVDPVAGILAAFAVYAVGFLMRPIGGFVFGSLGDRFGRKNILAFIILLMGGATLGIGLLPTYESIGLLAPILLVVCRLAQGLSAAGEATGSNSFVAEHAPDRWRGSYVAFTYSFANIAPIFAALCVLFVSTIMSAEAYLDWGWRVPFLLSAPLAIVGLYIRSVVDETPAFEATKAANRVARSPLSEAWRTQKKGMVQTFALAALSSLGFYILAGYFVTYLTTTVGISSSQALIANSIALLVAFITMNASAYISDRIGRKPVLLTGIGLTALLSVPAFMLASSGSFQAAIAGQALVAFVTGIFFGPLPVVLLELFPTRVRFSASAVSLNLAYAMFGGTAPLVATLLITETGSKLAPAFYMTVVAIATLIVAFTLKETSTASLVQVEDTGNGKL